MAEINWGLLQQPDYFGDAMKYRVAGQQRRGAEQGGAALGAGDYLGAAKAYGAAGMSDQALQATRLNDQQGEAAKTAAQERAKTLLNVAGGLARVPMGQRKAALQGAYPLFQAAGIDTSPFDNLTEDRLTDANLNAFAGDVTKQVEQYTLAPGSKRFDATGRLIAEAPVAPQYHTVGEGQSLVQTGGDAPPAPAQAPPQGDWRAAVAAAAPDAQVTSGLRTPEHNAAVGGRPSSKHLTGQAVDLVPKPGETMGQLYARVSGVPGVRAINEGDHVHVQANPGVAAPQATGGARVVAQGAPKSAKAVARPATPAEKAAYGIPSDVPAQFDPGTGKIDVISGVAARAKAVPPAIQGGYVANNQALQQIEQTIALVKANPDAFGAKNVAGDEIMQRLDPKGIKPRAAVANIAAVKIHDLSGAAVTAAETPRLKPFVPMPTDNAQAIVAKLEQYRDQLTNNNSQIEVQYGPESGYAPLSGSQRQAVAAAAPPRNAAPQRAAQTQRQPAQPGGLPPQARSQLQAGHITTFANGQSWTLRNGQPAQVKN